jgi:hypothetical protein
MYVLSLTQPWASLMALGEKTVETRSWRPPAHAVGQRIAIHAAAGLSPIGGERGLRRLLDTEPFTATLFVKREQLGLPFTGGDLATLGFPQACARILPRGVIVAWGTLHAVHPTEQAVHTIQTSGWPEHELDFGDYTSGRYAWFFRDVHTVDPPVARRGGQGLRVLPVDTVDQVMSRSRTIRQHPVAVRSALN